MLKKLRPVDLAREHGISPQAVRNYEQDGLIPPAERTASGYRVYTEVHMAALRAFLALIPAHGYAIAREVMRALDTGLLDAALTAIDRGHAQLLRDRETLDSVAQAVAHVTAAPDTEATTQGRRTAFSIGTLARRLGVTAATLRNWEDAGILVPSAHPVTAPTTRTTSAMRSSRTSCAAAVTRSTRSLPSSSRSAWPAARQRSPPRWRTGNNA